MNTEKTLNDSRAVRGNLGVTKQMFYTLLPLFNLIISEEMAKKPNTCKIGKGRKHTLKNTEKLFYILWYLKNYLTVDATAMVFNTSKSSAGKWFLDFLPLLLKTLARLGVVPIEKVNSAEDFRRAFENETEIFIDGFERPTQRSKNEKCQRKHYSGKKKNHTRKSVIICNSKRKILVITPAKHGKLHDKKILDKAVIPPRIPQEIAIIADTGFQGIQTNHPKTLLPMKKSKKYPLNQEEKLLNRLISSVRVVVEHAISGIKKFRAVSAVLRSKHGIDNTITKICCGLFNLSFIL